MTEEKLVICKSLRVSWEINFIKKHKLWKNCMCIYINNWN